MCSFLIKKIRQSMDEFKNLPKNKKILLHFAGFTVFIYRRGKGGDYFGKHEMENPQNRKHPTLICPLSSRQVKYLKISLLNCRADYLCMAAFSYATHFSLYF